MNVKINQKLLDLFKERNVYFANGGAQRLKIGDLLDVEANQKIEPYTLFLTGNSVWSMGSFSFSWTSSWTSWKTNVSVGRYCSIAGSSRIFGSEHPYSRFSSSGVIYDRNFVSFFPEYEKEAEKNNFVVEPFVTPPRSLTIGNDVWIGSHCAFKPGITIHDGAVIATGAVVTKDVPPYAIVGGVPAKVIKMRFPDNIIWEMLKLQWWDYCFADFKNIHSDIPVDQFINCVKQDIANGKLQKFEPVLLTGAEIIATANE